MKVKKISFLTFLSVLLFLLVGCAEQPVNQTITESKPELKGYWKSLSYGDGFEIIGSMYYQYDDASKSISFAGEIANNASWTASTGFVTVKITNSGSWSKTLNEYYVVRWKDFVSSKVKQSSPYKVNGFSTVSTKDGAEQEFTEENGYYTFYGDYVKQ
ncbi:MAG: hypothetical protein A2Y34_18455 [Spirochaetes bacterium GWC1_27_15]|nr:MAG: hypothetical protein A2Z98_02860 [Spirochaetes bacterium GWB1_27_13]OHD27059.1 MAG: hypothetical protein A2Y34_18455 [Spirochaetes bacterium GWC1_27_15]